MFVSTDNQYPDDLQCPPEGRCQKIEMVISIGKCGFKVPIFNDHISWKYPSWTIDDRIGHPRVQRSLSLLSCFGFASSQSIPMGSQNSLRIAGCDGKRMRLPPTNAHSKIALNLNDYWLKCTQSKKILPLLFLTTKTKHSPTIIYVLRIVLRVGLRVVYGVIFGYSKHPFEPSQDFAIAQYQLDCLRQHLLLPHLKD